MALDTNEYQRLILAEVGDTGVVEPWIDTIWSLYSDFGASDPRLQYLYAKVKAIDMLEGAMREQVQFMVHDNLDVYMQQKFDHLVKMRTQAVADIQQAQTVNTTLVVSGGLAPKTDFLITTAPIMSPTGQPDANDPYYRGDPNQGGMIRFVE